MSQITLQGSKRTLECTIEECKKINKMKEDQKDSRTPLIISGVYLTLGDIRYATFDGETDKQKISDERKKENNEHYDQQVQDYNDFIVRRCKMSVEEKANNISLFETLYFGVTAKKLSDEQKKYIIKLQKEYFQENPTHPYAKINYFKFLKDIPDNKDTFNMRYHTGTFSLRLTVKIIEQAFFTAYSLNLIPKTI